MFSSSMWAGTTGLITHCNTPSRSVSFETSLLCWVEITTASTRTGLEPSYSTVTWDFPSGLTKSMMPFRRTSARRKQSLWAIIMGRGINSSVSSQAKPNINPWSPAPPVPTPMSISELWRVRFT